MAPAADVSVVVVTLNALPWVERCLASVRGSDVVVVDHGSTDGTLELVRERFPEVRIVEQENRGMGGGNNAGMRVAGGRYWFLLNSDAWVVGDGLARLVAFAEAHPEAAVVGPRLANTDGTLQRSARSEPTVWRLTTEYAGVRKLAPGSSLLNPLYVGGFDHRSVREVDWLSGAALLVRRAAADEVGLFDESFFMFSEEVDWLTRFRRGGLEGALLPAGRGRPRRRCNARRADVRREPPWTTALPRQASGPPRGGACASGAAVVAAGERARVPGRARRDLSRRRALPRLRRRRRAPRRRSRSVIEYLRLAFGTAVVLAPGAAVARALGRRSAASLLAWSAAAVFVAWAVVFTVHSTIRLAAGVLALIFVVAVVVAVLRPRQRSSERQPLRSRWPWLVGLVLGWFLWGVAGAVSGDGLFHEARVRKLVALGDLHLRTVDEFKDGGLHPGYAFPLWHGFLALVSWVSGVDPATVIRHEPSLLAPLACALAFEAGAAVFGSRWGGASVLLATLAMFAFGPGHGGSYAELAQPATAARQLFVPAVIALFFAAPSWRVRAELAAVFGALALVHPTYALFILVPFAGVRAAAATGVA